MTRLLLNLPIRRVQSGQPKYCTSLVILYVYLLLLSVDYIVPVVTVMHCDTVWFFQGEAANAPSLYAYTTK
jgi:hypothetical protein